VVLSVYAGRAAGDPSDGREEADFFVVADRLGGDADVVGQFSDSHESDDAT